MGAPGVPVPRMGVGASIFSRRNKCVHAMIFVFFDDAPRWSGVKRIAARAAAHDVHGASSNSKGTVSAAFYIFLLFLYCRRVVAGATAFLGSNLKQTRIQIKIRSGLCGSDLSSTTSKCLHHNLVILVYDHVLLH